MKKRYSTGNRLNYAMQKDDKMLPAPLSARRKKLGTIFCAGLFATLISLSSTSFVSASTANNGTINDIISMPSGVFLFNSTGARTAVPSCATNEPARWAINGSTAAGQSTIAVVLSAYAAGKQVFIYGAATCNAWGDTEDIQYVEIVN